MQNVPYTGPRPPVAGIAISSETPVKQLVTCTLQSYLFWDESDVDETKMRRKWDDDETETRWRWDGNEMTMRRKRDENEMKRTQNDTKMRSWRRDQKEAPKCPKIGGTQTLRPRFLTEANWSLFQNWNQISSAFPVKMRKPPYTPKCKMSLTPVPDLLWLV